MRLRLGSWFARAAAGLLMIAAAAAPGQAPAQGFLAQRLDVRVWLPPAPAPGSLAQAEDETVYLHTRALLDTPRGAEAAADNVYLPDAVAPRFAEAPGATLTPQDTPLTPAPIGRGVKDAEALVGPRQQPPPPPGTRPVPPV